MHRHELTDEQWQRIAPLLPEERGHSSRPAKLRNRVFINAILYIAKTCAPWRDLPERFGPWKTVHNKFSRWNASRVFDGVLQIFAGDADHESSIIDASYVRAHQHSAGGKGGPRFNVLDALAELEPQRSLSSRRETCERLARRLLNQENSALSASSAVKNPSCSG